MHIIIFTGGTLTDSQAVRQAISSADYVIAADSGAATALDYACPPALIVGDLDSLAPRLAQQLREHGSKVLQVPVEKDETDTELAILTALEHGATDITILGGLAGRRFDHAIANIMLLAAFPDISLRIVDGPGTCWLLHGPGKTTITGKLHDLVSLFPLTATATGITTEGLYYSLTHALLYFGRSRGISNYLIKETAQVSLEEGMLLIVHTAIQEIEEI